MPENTELNRWTRVDVSEQFGPSLTKDLFSSFDRNVLGKDPGAPGNRDKKYDSREVRIISGLLEDQSVGLDLKEIAARHETTEGIGEDPVGHAPEPVRVDRIVNAFISYSGASPRDRLRAALEVLARDAAGLMNAEHCAIFLYSPECNCLVVEADSRIPPDATHVGLALRLDSGFTGRAYTQDRMLNLFGPALGGTPSAPPATVSHLHGPRKSLLAVPIPNRKGSTKQVPLSGVLKIENKKPAYRDRPRPFTYDDVCKALLIVANVRLILQTELLLRCSSELTEGLRNRTTFRALSRSALAYAVAQTGATLGEVARATADNPDHPFDLVVEASTANSILKPGHVVREPSISSSVVKLKDDEIRFEAWSVNEKPPRDYRDCNPDMLSEAVVPLRAGDLTFGVLNVESAAEALSKKDDEAPLRLISSYLGAAGQMTALQDAIQDELLNRQTGERVFSELLEAIERQDTRFSHGLGYLASFREGLLKTVAWKNCRGHGSHFQISFDEPEAAGKYAAAKALREGKCYFSRFPENDTNVAQGGVEKFDVSGSLLAVPVRFPSSLMPIIVGALVVWTGGDRLSPAELTAENTDALERIATLTVTARGSHIGDAAR